MQRALRNQIATGLAGGMMDTLKCSDFESRVEKAKMPALIIFSSPECVPCKLMARDISELESLYRGKVAFFKVDTREDLELTEKLSVVSTPTLILFMNGKPVMRTVGYVSKLDIRTMIDAQISLCSN